MAPTFLEHATRFLQVRGFNQYVAPRIHWDVNRQGGPTRGAGASAGAAPRTPPVLRHSSRTTAGAP
eukprot:5253459-Alexandrium_andersonii.AAC.1